MSNPLPKVFDHKTLESSMFKPLELASLEANILHYAKPIPKKKKIIYSAAVAYPGMFKKDKKTN
jgi:hypothetical protein